MRCRRRSRRCTRWRPASRSTDWEQIAALYALLERSDPSPVVALNRALAVSFADSPEAALSLLDELAGQLSDYSSFHAALADVERRRGDVTAAPAADPPQALELTDNPGEREFLERRVDQLGE